MTLDRVNAEITRWGKIAAIFLCGWMASSIWHQTYVSDRAAAVLPAVQAEAGCEHYRGNKATAVARQAIVAANSEDALAPSASAIPKDNCPHPVLPPLHVTAPK